MLEAWLTAESALELSEEAVDEPQDHHATSEQAGVHLYSPVDAGSGAPPSREYRASVRVEGQGAGIGLDRDGDPHAGPGSRSVGHADDGTGGLQDAGGGCLDGTGGRSVCPGGVAPGALEPGLASTARVVRAHTYPGNRRRRGIRSVMLMPSFVCSRGDNEMVPHARFEFLECGDAFRGIREQEPLVMRVALYTDDAVADAPL